MVHWAAGFIMQVPLAQSSTQRPERRPQIVPVGQSLLDMQGPHSPPGAFSHWFCALHTPPLQSALLRQPGAQRIPSQKVPCGHWASEVQLPPCAGTQRSVAGSQVSPAWQSVGVFWQFRPTQT